MSKLRNNHLLKRSKESQDSQPSRVPQLKQQRVKKKRRKVLQLPTRKANSHLLQLNHPKLKLYLKSIIMRRTTRMDLKVKKSRMNLSPSIILKRRLPNKQPWPRT